MTDTNSNSPVYAAVQEAPAPARRRGRANGLHDTLVQIQATPGVWFRVGNFRSKTGASSVISAIKHEKRVVPAGDYEFTGRTLDEGSALFARFLGDDAATDAVTV